MAKLGYKLPQSVMDDFNAFHEGDKSYTGLSFSWSGKRFMTCTCGHKQEFITGIENCPQCGGLISHLNENRLLRCHFRSYKTFVERDEKKFVCGIKTLDIGYDTSTGNYCSDYAVSKRAKGTFSPLHVEKIPTTVAYDPYGVNGSLVDKICGMPEFQILRDFGRFKINDVDSLIATINVINTTGVTREEIQRSPFIYGFYFKEVNDCGFSTVGTVKDYVRRMGFNDKAVDFVINNKVSFPYWYGSITQVVEMMNYLFDDEMPDGEFFLELFSRGVMTIEDLKSIVDTYKALKSGTIQLPVLVEPGVACLYNTDKEKVNPDLADIFVWFCKKNSFRSKGLAKEFLTRVKSLRTIGESLIQENFLDRQYFKSLNGLKFSCSDLDFEAKFEKNPLDVLKNMK